MMALTLLWKDGGVVLLFMLVFSFNAWYVTLAYYHRLHSTAWIKLFQLIRYIFSAFLNAIILDGYNMLLELTA